LDLDSTRLLHEDGHQKGVVVGYTRTPGWVPSLACIPPNRRVGGTQAVSGSLAQTRKRQLCQQRRGLHDRSIELPSFIHPRVARADSGFCVPEWLDMLEARRLRYVVVARLFKPSQRVLRQDLIWETSEGPGPEVAEIEHQEANWSQPRRGSCCDMGSRTRSGPEARSGSTTRVTSIRRWSPTCP